MFTIENLDKNIAFNPTAVPWAYNENHKSVYPDDLTKQLEKLYNKMSQVGGDFYPQTDVILGKRIMLLEVIKYIEGLE